MSEEVGSESLKIGAILPCLGIIGNVVFLTYLIKHRIGTKISSVLLRIQTIVDTIICVFCVVELLQTRFWYIDVLFIDQIVCYLWHTQVMYWFLIFCSIHTLIFSVIERFVIVVFPFIYKKLKIRHILIPLGILYLIGMGLSSILLFEAGYLPGQDKCTLSFKYFAELYPFLINIRLAIAVIIFSFDFVYPALITIILSTFVIHKLKASKKQSTSNKTNISVRFTFATLIIAMIMSLSTSYDSVFYLLLSFNIIDAYYANSDNVKIGVIFAALNSSVNPYVYLLLMPGFRRYILYIVTFGKLYSEENKQQSCIEHVNRNSFVARPKKNQVSALPKTELTDEFENSNPVAVDGPDVGKVNEGYVTDGFQPGNEEANKTQF